MSEPNGTKYQDIIDALNNNKEILTAENYTELDGIILAELSGKKHRDHIPPGEKAYLKDVCGKLRNSTSTKDEDLKALYEAVSKSERYSKVLISDPIDTRIPTSTQTHYKGTEMAEWNGEYINPETGEKYYSDFKALTYHFNDGTNGENGTILVSYAGTGSSTYSWIEDLRLSYTDYGIGAQRQASTYFDYVASKYSKSDIYMSGYSKGGNLMIYAAADQANKYNNRIKDIKNFDGPGVRESLILNEDGSLTEFGEKFTQIKSRITNYSPKNSFVGKLMKNWEEYVFIDDKDKFFVANHDYANWKVTENGQFGLQISPSGDTELSIVVDRILDNIVSNMTEEELREVCDFLEEFIRMAEEKVYPDDPGGKFKIDEAGKYILSHLGMFFTFYNDHEDKEAVKKFLTLLVTEENIVDILYAHEYDKGKKKNTVTKLEMGKIAAFSVIAAVIIGGVVVLYEGVVIIDEIKDYISEKYNDVKTWLTENIDKVYTYFTEEVPKKVNAFLDRADAYVDKKLNEAKNALDALKQKALSACKDIFQQARVEAKNCWDKVNKWACIAAMGGGSAYLQLDMDGLKACFDRLTYLSRRIQDLDNVLHSLYGRLCLNDIEEGEILTSIANLYHLVRSDIIIDDAWVVRGCRARLYNLINAFETGEKEMSAKING